MARVALPAPRSPAAPTLTFPPMVASSTSASPSPGEKSSSASSSPDPASSASFAPNPPRDFRASCRGGFIQSFFPSPCPRSLLSQIRRDKPAVPPRVFYSRGPVPIRLVLRHLNRGGPRLHRSRISRIRIRHVHMQVARHRLKLSVRFVNLQRGVPDPHCRVQHGALRRLVHAHRLGPEHCLHKRNHVMRLAKMQVWLHRAQPLRPRRPSTRLGDVPM